MSPKNLRQPLLTIVVLSLILIALVDGTYNEFSQSQSGRVYAQQDGFHATILPSDQARTRGGQIATNLIGQNPLDSHNPRSIAINNVEPAQGVTRRFRGRHIDPLVPRETFMSPPEARSQDVTTIRWFMRWDDVRIRQIAVPLLERFHTENPNIRVVVENMSSGHNYVRQLHLRFESGTPPDVFYPATHVAYDLSLRGYLLSLIPLIRADAMTLSAYDSKLLPLYRNPQGELHCLPIDIATLAVAYNPRLFDEAGIPYPVAPWTWDDLLNTARQLTVDDDGDGVPEQYGIDRFHTYWPLLVWARTGHNVFDDPYRPTEFLLEEQDSVDAIQWLADLHLQHGVMPGEDGIDGVDDPFLSGQAAMQIAGHWRVPTYLATRDLAFDFVSLPHDEYFANRIDGSCFAIAKETEHPEAAWTFVNFLAGPNGIGAKLLTELQQITPALTALRDSTAFLTPIVLPDKNWSAFLPEMVDESYAIQKFPLYDPLHPLLAAWEPIANQELHVVWSGRRSADAAVGRMANAAEGLLEDLPTIEAMAKPKGATQAETEIVVDANSALTQNDPLTAATPLTAPFAVTVPPQSFVDYSLTMQQLPQHYYVAPTGNDDNRGVRAAAPLATLQQALELVAPGDTIHLAAGHYYENVASVTDGRVDAPITIMGPADAILHGSGDASAAFYLSHNYYTLTGFTIDGLYGDPTDKDGYTQKLLYVQGQNVRQGVTGLRVLNMTFRNAGGECLRLRYFAQRNEIAYSTFHVCGLLDFVFDDGGKNGEAIYIGTSTDQWEDGKNPTSDPDESSYNWIHHNTMNTQGNECVEVKEGGYANLIEYNLCTGQLDDDSAGLGIRGNENILRYNTVYGNVGAGVRLGGREVSGLQYGVGNDVYGNYLFNNVAGGVKIIVEPQTLICGNRVERNLGKAVFGTGSEGYEPAVPC